MSLVSSDLNQATPERPSMSTAQFDKNKVISELKNGKIIFKQKPLSFDNLSETMQEIVSFRSLLENSNAPLLSIPDNHLPLIAKLVHESDKSLSTLTKTLRSSLLPPTITSSQICESVEGIDALPASTLEEAIKAVAERTNYGITMDKPPAAMCVWRWEVKNREWLPKSVRENAIARLRERVVAKKHIQTLFDNLPGDQQELILKSGKPGKIPKGKECNVLAVGNEAGISQSTPEDQNSEVASLHEENKKWSGRPKKPVDPEVAAKEKERQEKKIMKAERERKAIEANKRSAVAFANFFKPVATSSGGSEFLKMATSQGFSSRNASPSTSLSEFETTFKPFVVKKDAQLAPINWFLTRKQNTVPHHRCISTQNVQMSVIELDDEGEEPRRPPEDQSTTVDVEYKEENLSNLTPGELLRSFLDTRPPALHLVLDGLHFRRPFTKPKPSYNVREIVDQLSEAEVQGDQRTVRRLVALLKSRRKIPAKVFVFAENVRPGYLGTWTKSSSTIGPRTPFVRDLLSLDYDYDSDGEWDEEEEGGEDIDSPDDSIEDDNSSVGSDMDGWLVEGDEVEIETAVPEGTSPPSLQNSNKRKSSSGTSESANKKPKVVPLIPFHKGPIWEKQVGRCEYEPFRTMRIQPFNDTPLPIDPFVFTSEPLVIDKASPATNQRDSGAVFAIPALPGHLTLTPDTVAQPSTTDTRLGRRKRAIQPVPPPKTVFPDAHIPVLFGKIGASNTNSFAVLLDSVFQDVKSLGIRKNALEVKLREVVEKDKITKGWVVKEDAWTRHGLVKPS